MTARTSSARTEIIAAIITLILVGLLTLGLLQFVVVQPPSAPVATPPAPALAAGLALPAGHAPGAACLPAIVAG